jgi:predicted transcriptional regulator
LPMILPEELASKSVIPALRALIVKRLVEDHGMTQQEAAKLLGVTQPAVSKYLHEKRGTAIKLTGIREIDQATTEIAEMVSTQKTKPIEVMSKIEEACEYVRKNRYMCDLHKKLEPGMDTESCHICEK